MNIQVPWNRKMAINMKNAAIFDHTQVVQVDPVDSSVLIQVAYYIIQQVNIRLIHNAGHRGADNRVARVQNNECKNNSYGTIDPGFACKIDQSNTEHHAQGGIRIGLKVFTTRDQRERIILLSFLNAAISYCKIDDGGNG